jgi:hypothetical protein
MLQVPLNKAYIKRTIRPLYGPTQSTPKSAFLDPAWDRSVDIYPGMVMMRKGGDLVTLADGTGYPMGLSALYIGGDGLDEVADAGVNATAVWVLGPDAEFEVLAPAFDDGLTWTDPTDGTSALVHYWATGDDRGKLAPAGASKAAHTLSSRPVGRLLKVASTKKIVVGGLVGTTA